MKKFIISPPFGNFISHPLCTSVMGTYTLHRRGGWPKKLYRGLLTIRRTKGGWVNNIGLQNPGIKAIKKFYPHKIYSVAAIEPSDWDELLPCIPPNVTVEVNIGCPNVKHTVEMTDEQILAYLKKFERVIFKLSATDSIHTQGENLVRLGAKYLHVANTLPTHKGGESGGRLKEFSLHAIRKIRKKYPHIQIIGGGGIYSPQDVELYQDAGANYFSLASIWFYPIKAITLLKKMSR